MNSDEASLLGTLLADLETVGLEAIIIGTTAAVLQGAPVMTQDVDLLVRDTPRNREKIDRLAEKLGTGRPVQLSPLSSTVRLIRADLNLDLVFDALPGGLSFESIRSRCVKVPLSGHAATVALLEDVIRSKEAANRPKDQAQLPILRDTLKVREALAKEKP
jgi:hypothetical protein